MKRFIQNSCSWLAMLFTCVAFAISSSASAQDVTFNLGNQGSSSVTKHGVTLNFSNYFQGANVWSTHNETYSLAINSEEEIEKIEFEGMEYGNSSLEEANGLGAFTFDRYGTSTWTGSAKTLKFWGTTDATDYYIYALRIWIKGGTGTEPTPEGNMEVSSISPAEGEVSTDNGLHYFTIYFEENFANNLSCHNGDPIPEGITFTSDQGQNFPLDAKGFTTWAGSNQMNISIAQGIYEPGTYTLHVPAGVNFGESGRPNPELNLTWTLVTPSIPEPEVDLSKFVGNYKFHGNDPYINYDEDWLAPKSDYNCELFIDEDGKLAMTGLIGKVWDWPYYYQAIYNAEANTITFTADGSYVVDDSYEYYIANNDLVLNVVEDEEGAIKFVNNDGWHFLYEDWYYTQYAAGYNGAIEMVKESGEIVEPEPEPEPEPEVDLSKLVGDYLFHGEGGYNNDPETEILPEEYYEVSIEAVDGKLHMTGLLGNVYSDPYCYVGTYNTTDNTVTFSVPTYYNYGYVMVTDYDYFLINDSFTLNVVEGEDGSLKFVKEDGWEFLFGWSWYKAGYTGAVELIKDGKIPAEPTGWNGEVLFPEATSIDDLLSCTLEFDGAEVVTASNHDVLGVIYDETGDPYAIAMGNEVYSVFGGVSSEANKVSVNFVKIAELNANLQASARKAAARIGNFQSGNGSACVAFASKSFKVDGVLVDDVIAHKYEFAGNGTTTGIETIATEGNNATFDLSGRRVVNHANGLYIVGGRKVIK